MSKEKAEPPGEAEGGNAEVFEKEDDHVTFCTSEFVNFLRSHGIFFGHIQSGIVSENDDKFSDEHGEDKETVVILCNKSSSEFMYGLFDISSNVMIGELLRTPPTSSERLQQQQQPNHQISPSQFATYPFEWVHGSAYAAYSTTGRPYIVKVSAAGSLETSLLLQARELREKRSEDVCLPVLHAHIYNHPASINLLVMEFSERGTLSNLLKVAGHVPMHRQYTARIMYGIANAVHFLHTQNIYHGAIRASNVLVDLYMRGRLGGLSTVWNVIKGRRVKCTQIVAYRAPEAGHEGAQALPQDMFAVGVILYRCVTTTMPKRKDSGVIDYRTITASSHIPLDAELWRTTQLLLSDKLDMRPDSGELLHTAWIQRSQSEPIKQIFNWNSLNNVA